jgi:tetratricopeptide (TPR) repeat protein
MEKINTGLTKDIENLLNEYLGKDNTDNFFQSLKESVLGKFDDAAQGDSQDQVQLKSEINPGVNERDLVNRIVTYAEEMLEIEKLLQLLLDLSQLMTFNGEISVATELSDDVISKTENENKLSKYRADAYLSLARIAWSQAYWDQSQEYVQKSFNIFTTIEDKEGFARCENMLATIYGEKGDIKESLNHLEKGLLFLADSDNTELRAMFEVNLGILYNIQGDRGKALWNLKNGLAKYEQLKDMRKVSRVRHNLGMIYTKMEDYQAAIEEFNRNISISIENGYLSNCAIGYIGKAYIYTKLKNTALADVFTDKAMEISYKINDTLSIAEVYKIKGMIQSDLENFELSEELFENSLRLNEDLGNDLNKAESYYELIDLYEKTDQKDKAEQVKQTASEYFGKLTPDNKK